MVCVAFALSLDKIKHYMWGYHMVFSLCSVVKKNYWLQVVDLLGTLMTANRTTQIYFLVFKWSQSSQGKIVCGTNPLVILLAIETLMMCPKELMQALLPMGHQFIILVRHFPNLKAY